MVTDDGEQLSWRALAVIVALGLVLVGLSVGLGLLEPKASAPLSRQPVADQQAASDVSHVDPASVGERGDLDRLERELAEVFSRHVRDGSLVVDEASRARIQQRLGSERYQRLREQYRRIAAETGAERRYALLERANEAQRALARNVSTYWDLHETYEILTRGSGDVTANDSTRNPRAIARTLERRASAVNESAASAIFAYHNLSSYTEGDYDGSIEAFRSTRRNVTAAQREVRTEQFVPTRISLAAEEATISPTRPLVTAGRITARDGTPLANRRVPLRVGVENRTVRTNASGWFELRYRPALLPANATELRVRHDPGNTSIYLGGATTVDVTVRRVEPDVSVSATPSVADFNRTVVVSGRVYAGGSGFRGVPYVVTIDGRAVAENETGPDGRIVEPIVLGARIPPGAHDLRLHLPAEGRALRNTSASMRLEVVRTDATLALEARPDDERTVRVTGRLATVDGEPIDNETVRFSVDGQLVGTTQTAADGTYGRALVVPATSTDDANEASVTATFDASGTNLNPASASASVVVPTGSDGPSIPLPIVLGVGALAAIALGGYTLLRGRSWGRAAEPDATSTSPAERRPGDRPSRTGAALLERAETRLSDGDPSAAIEAGYAALRLQLGGTAELARPQTGWEFYRAHRSGLDDEAADALRRATEGYQRATFGGESVEADVARELLADVRQVLDRRARDGGD